MKNQINAYSLMFSGALGLTVLSLTENIATSVCSAILGFSYCLFWKAIKKIP